MAIVFYLVNQRPLGFKNDRYHDSPVPIDLSDFPWSWVVLIALTVLASALLLYFYKRKSGPSEQIKETEPEVDPFAQALEQLDELSSLMPKLNAKPFIFKLSEILRLYVERQFKLPAMEKTGEEFIHEVSIHPLLRQKFEIPLKKFVQRGDLIKYSAENFNAQELKSLLDSAREFVSDAQKDWEERRRIYEEKESSGGKVKKSSL